MLRQWRSRRAGASRSGRQVFPAVQFQALAQARVRPLGRSLVPGLETGPGLLELELAPGPALGLLPPVAAHPRLRCRTRAPLSVPAAAAAPVGPRLDRPHPRPRSSWCWRRTSWRSAHVCSWVLRSQQLQQLQQLRREGPGLGDAPWFPYRLGRPLCIFQGWRRSGFSRTNGKKCSLAVVTE